MRGRKYFPNRVLGLGVYVLSRAGPGELARVICLFKFAAAAGTSD
jgi:hypothetical protein